MGSSRTRARTRVPALAGRFLTTVPPGKSLLLFLNGGPGVCLFLMFLFIWLCWVLTAACGLFTAARGLLSSCGVQALERVGSVVACGLSSCGMRAPEHVGSVVAASGLSCPAAFGILVPNQGSNPTPPHRKADS